MRSNIEHIFRTIASSDETIAREDISSALNILCNRQATDAPLVSILKTKEAARLLGVTLQTIHHYVARGLLVKVYGAGTIPLGISRESFIHFTERNSVEEHRKGIHRLQREANG